MKRVLFVLAVLGFSGLLSYFSLFREPDAPALRSDTLGVDLTEGVRYVKFSTGSVDGADKSFSGKTVPKEGYLRLSPISGVSYEQGDVPKSMGKSVVIGKGLYFFSLGDIFQDVTVENPDFKIKTLGRGNFYVDSRNPASVKFFSVSALLTVDLVSSGKTVTTAHVFPSTYFGYVPSYNSELKNADILRISTINTIRYVDLKNPTGEDPVMNGDAVALGFFKKNLAAERARASEYSKAYSTVFRLSENVPADDLFEDFNWYFVNHEKKSAILKGRILRDIRNLAVSERCESTQKCQNANVGISSIADTLSKMEELDPALKEYGLEAIRRAYYLSYYESLGRADEYFRTKTSNAFVSAVVRTRPGLKIEAADYALLSEIHAAYYYGDKDASKLDEYLNAYVRSLLNGKVIRKTEFLPYSFFLKEYLNREGFAISKTTLDIALSLVSVSSEYYDTLATDDQRFSTLTVLYYTYSKIVDRVRKATAAEFFTQKDGGAYLKDEYLDQAGNANLPAGFADSFDSLVKVFETGHAKQQRQLYASFLNKSPDKKVSDTLTLFDKSLDALRDQSSIFADYPGYLQKISLDDSTREASGILFDKKYPTEDEIKKYFSTFNGVDPSTLKIKNDVTKDGYFDIDVMISGREFTFQLVTDEGYLIRNVTFDSGGQKNETFKFTSVSLDEKKDEYEKTLGGLSPDDPKYPIYVFANYFVNTYLSERSSFATATDDFTPSDAPPSTKMDARTLVFVEQNLIQKDFKNVVRGFPISIANIEAKIAGGTWDIDLSGIRKPMSGEGSSFVLEFKGKYLFDQHSFYKITAKALDSSSLTPDFGGAEIQIFPRAIPLAEIESRADELYEYVEKLRKVT